MKIRRAAGRQPSELNAIQRNPGTTFEEKCTQRANALPLARKSRRGVVLIVVLVLVMMLALAGFGFLSAMSTEYEAARLNGSMRQARQTMASAESTLLWFAGLSDRERMIMGGLHHNPALFRGHIIEPLSEPGTGNSSSATAAAPLVEQAMNSTTVDDRWRFSVVSLDRTPEQNSVLRFGLQNESSKLNLNNLLRWEQASPGQGRTSLMQLPGMTEAIADSILDWLDADEQTREFGAETEYYQTLDRPYRSANALPPQLTELLYVKGVTRQLLMGSDGPSSDGSLDNQPQQTPSVDANGDLSTNSETTGAGWLLLLTLHSAERNRNRVGQPRIFLNSASLSELEPQLAATLPATLVRYLLLARVYGLTLTAEPQPGVEPSAPPFAATMAPAFRINSLADVIDSSVKVTTSSGPIVVQSPLQSRNPEFAALVASLLDLTSVHADPVIAGRINLQTASESVLSTIPGLTPELVSQIVTQRAAQDPAESKSAVWLLSRGILDVTMFRRVFPDLTMGGDVFQGEIVVHRNVGGPLLRRNLIVDAASTPPRRVHWVDLTDSPMSFPQELLLPQSASSLQ